MRPIWSRRAFVSRRKSCFWPLQRMRPRKNSELVEARSGVPIVARTFQAIAYDIIGIVEGSKPGIDVAAQFLRPVTRRRRRPFRPTPQRHPPLPSGMAVIQREGPVARPVDTDGKSPHLAVEDLIVPTRFRHCLPHRLLVQPCQRRSKIRPLWRSKSRPVWGERLGACGPHIASPVQGALAVRPIL